jgi:hypothetical protein
LKRTGNSRYYHFSCLQLFLRGKPHLQNYMRRLPKTHKKLPMKKKDEPDFYKLDQTHPLPAIHEAPIPGAAATVQAMRAGAQQPVSPHSESMHTHLSPMTQQQGNGMVITPHVSPNHSGANIIGGPNNYQMASPTAGNMNSMGSTINAMGPGNMGMGNANAMAPGNMGMGNMTTMASGNMGGMGVMGTNGMGMGMGPSGMQAMGPGNMNMHRGPQGVGGHSFNARYGNYGDSDSFQDEFDNMQHQQMMVRGGNVGGSMGGQQPSHHQMGHMSNSGGYGSNNGHYNNMPPSNPSNMRRSVAMRQGVGMDHMHGGDRSPSQQRQPEYYQGYSQQQQQQQQQQMMMPPTHGMQMQHDMYGRSGYVPMSGHQDDYSTASLEGNMPHRHSTASLEGNMPHRPTHKRTGPRV